MRKFIWVILIFISIDVKSQETPIDTLNDLASVRQRPYEIAYTFLGINSKSEIMFSNRVPIEILNGILIRYKFNRLSLRLSASLSKFRNTKEYTQNCSACTYGNAELKNYKIGIGTQFTPFKKKELIYSYFDLSYKRRRENGTIVDVKDTVFTFDHYRTITDGLDFILGVGTKIKIYKNFYFSSELGYDYYFAKSKIKTVDVNSNELSHKTTPLTFQEVLGKIYLSLTF